MILVKTKSSRSQLEQQHIVYEKHDVLPKSLRVWNIHQMHLAMRGEYIRDTAGRCVPVLYRRNLRRRGRQELDLMLVFPGQTWIASKHAQRPFTWSLSPKTGEGKPTGERMVAKLVLVGIPPEQAFRQVYGIKASRRRMFRILNSNYLLECLMTEAGMQKDLRQALIDKGMTMDTMAEKFIKWLNDDKAVWPLRKLAAEKILEAMEKRSKVPSTGILEGSNQMQQLPPGVNIENFNAYMIQQVKQKDRELQGMEVPQMVSQSSVGENLDSSPGNRGTVDPLEANRITSIDGDDETIA